MATEKGPQTLAGKVAIVTGSSRGIGAAIALKLASHGANVVINYFSNPAKAQDVANKAESFGVKAITCRADVSKKADVALLFEDAKNQFGRIDIVMSNSGIEHFGEIESVTEEQMDSLFNTNVKGQFYVAQEAHKYLENNGRLMLISSISAVMGFPRHALYAATKSAIQGMCKCLAYDFGKRGITVNVIAPGGVKTDMWTDNARHYIEGGDKLSDEQIETMVASWGPMKRAGEVEDISNAVYLIASPEAQWITGQTIFASGGSYMS